MADYIQAEENIRQLFPVGSVFNFQGEDYRVVKSGKPRPPKGECKTDVYIKGVSETGKTVELKISVKKANADFIENKISLERAKEIFGDSAQEIVKKCVLSIKKVFEDDELVFFKRGKHTGQHTIKLGWKYEFVNKPGGNKSAIIGLTDSQKCDVYAGTNLSDDKRDSFVGDEVVPGSGVANYIIELNDNDRLSPEFVISHLRPISEYAVGQTLYFVCKALNYRFDKKKWDGPRPLAVYVDWKIDNGKLTASLVYDNPLTVNGNTVGDNLEQLLNELKISKFDQLRGVLSADVKTYNGKVAVIKKR